MHMYFSLALKKIRQHLKFTQKEMVQYLQNIIPSCSLLDEVSYSRWENNKTKPSLKKKIDILYSLNDKNSLQKIVNLNNKKSIQMANKVNSLLMSRYVFIDKIDRSPYTDESYKVTIEQEEVDLNKLDNIYYTYHNRMYKCNKDLNYLMKLAPSKYQAILYRFIDSNNKLIGHAIFIVAKKIDLISIYEQYQKIKVHDHTKEDYHLYLLSSYINSPECSHLLYNIIIKMNYDYKIKDTILKARNIQSTILINHIGGNIDFFGPKNNEGISIGKNKYSWLGYTVNNKNILSLPKLT